MDLDISYINRIIKKIIEEISSSRDQILNIIDNLRREKDDLEFKLAKIRSEVARVIEEVDELAKLDKAARKRLAEVSSNFDKYSEQDIKEAYEKASETRVKYYLKLNEEKQLRMQRDNLEMSLKKSLDSIASAEKVINQVSIALGYLNGDILPALEVGEGSSEMFLGIKILEAQENERKRIARDIHDGPAQHLANVIMKVDICKVVIQRDLQQGLKELEELKESVRAALKEVRGIIFDLRPMSLDDLGLIQTIQQTVKNISQESDIDIRMKIGTPKVDVEPIIQVAAYRIIQEIFNNIRKHSKARNAELKLDFGTKYLRLIITDDGIGFNVDETLKRVRENGDSYGLIGILDRVEQLHGEIQIESAEGTGSIFRVKLPVSREVIKDERQGN